MSQSMRNKRTVECVTDLYKRQAHVAVAENDKNKERAFLNVFLSCLKGTKCKPGMHLHGHG
jgi:hypothetical protein